MAFSLTMSVDKFGRHSLEIGKDVISLKREGFALTPDGDYDIKQKRVRYIGDPIDMGDAVNLKIMQNSIDPCLKLGESDKYDAMDKVICNASSPFEDKDVVNLKTLQNSIKPCLKRTETGHYDARGYSITNVGEPLNMFDAIPKDFLYNYTPIKLEDSFSVHQYRIQDLAYPVYNKDAVNLHFVKSNCVLHDVGIIDAQQCTIKNVKEGYDDSDAATIGQTIQLKDSKWTAKNKQITDVNEGIGPTDVVTVSQMQNKFLEIKDLKWDGQNKVITNVHSGTTFSDVATIGQIMQLKDGKWMANKKQITGVNMGIEPTDVVTVSQIKNKFLEIKNNKWDGNNRVLSNIHDGIESKDVPTMQQILTYTKDGIKQGNKNFKFMESKQDNWEGNGKSITNVAPGVALTDVCILDQVVTYDRVNKVFKCGNEELQLVVNDPIYPVLCANHRLQTNIMHYKTRQMFRGQYAVYLKDGHLLDRDGYRVIWDEENRITKLDRTDNKNYWGEAALSINEDQYNSQS